MRELSIMVDEKQLQVRYSTHVSVIEPTEITLNGPDGEETVPNDFVFAMIGNVPDVHFLRRAGIDVDPGDKKPVYDPETFETNVPGIYVVGSLTREPHIFNGRLRAAKIVDHIVSELRGSKPR
jgi:thioredoxin reductase (NADPH)